MKTSDLAFSGIRNIPVYLLGISQLYISEDKIKNVLAWFRKNDFSHYAPLPVHDFGNDRLTLTDGHTRAYVAWQSGISEIPVKYDSDDIVASDEGIKLYQNDIAWCDRFNLKSVCDLAGRIVSGSEYKRLWEDRCDVGYNLIINSSEQEKVLWARLHSNLFLFGVSEDKKRLFYENTAGDVFVFDAK
ncbi:MAG: hypothetical protein IJU96_07850 [Clostridia bacterium]|nr:hypothetical protein [Clostridia bacterium]